MYLAFGLGPVVLLSELFPGSAVGLGLKLPIKPYSALTDGLGVRSHKLWCEEQALLGTLWGVFGKTWLSYGMLGTAAVYCGRTLGIFAGALEVCEEAMRLLYRGYVSGVPAVLNMESMAIVRRLVAQCQAISPLHDDFWLDPKNWAHCREMYFYHETGALNGVVKAALGAAAAGAAVLGATPEKAGKAMVWPLRLLGVLVGVVVWQSPWALFAMER